MINYDDNPDALKAIEAINNGDNLCLIGKAGAGKTTLIKHLVDVLGVKPTILAPTGIAAINCGGRTIHSLFKFPFRVLEKEVIERRYKSYSKEDLAMYKNISLLVIDEISMVRADILDAIDFTLRYANNVDKPFGGVQTILVGDPYQLPPVVTNKKAEDSEKTEQAIISELYRSAFFFNSNVFEKDKLSVVELKKVYRQSDDTFISILNGIRNGGVSMNDIDVLNNRVGKTNGENIYLTSVRKFADSINERNMNAIKEPQFNYKGFINDRFPKSMIPQDSQFVALKKGARVMTTYNDSEGRYVNGSIGTIIDIAQKAITIDLDPDYAIGKENVIVVSNVTIQHVNSKGEVIGTYSFMPVKAAWAITIHKSQGLTFSNVNICPRKIFASGQLYVALSRCRSLEGTILTDPVLPEYIKVDSRIKKFIESYAGKEG